MNAFLRPHFPVLFGHFDSTIPGFRDIPDEPDSAGLKKLDYQLPYVLLKKERKNYSVIDKTHPTATSYQEHLTGEKNKTAGFKAKTLFLGESTSADPNVYMLTDLQSYQSTYPTRDCS